MRVFLIIQREIESDLAFSFPERVRFVSMIDRVLLSGKSVAMPSFRSKSGTYGFLMTPITCILVLPNNNCSRFKSFEGLLIRLIKRSDNNRTMAQSFLPMLWLL